MFLIAARFALSFGGDTWKQPEFLECSSCKLEFHFKSKAIITNLEKGFLTYPTNPLSKYWSTEGGKELYGKSNHLRL